MKNWNYAVLTLAFCLVSSGLALARESASMTPEKEAVMTKAHEEFNTATAELRKQIFAKESALNAEIYGEKPDDARVNALVGEINALHARIYAEQVTLRKKLAKENIFPEMGGHGMKPDGCPMMGGKHGGKNMEDMPRHRSGMDAGHGGHGRHSGQSAM